MIIYNVTMKVDWTIAEEWLQWMQEIYIREIISTGCFDELSNELHSSNMDFDIDGAEYTWIFISEDLDDFKEKVKKAAEMVKIGDERIGK